MVETLLLKLLAFVKFSGPLFALDRFEARDVTKDTYRDESPEILDFYLCTPAGRRRFFYN